jgi:hypothetical protein
MDYTSSKRMVEMPKIPDKSNSPPLSQLYDNNHENRYFIHYRTKTKKS